MARYQMVFLFFLALVLLSPLSAESEPFVPVEEVLHSEEAAPGWETDTSEDTLLAWEADHGDELFLGGEAELDEKTLLSEESDLKGEMLTSGDELFDEDDFFDLFYEASSLVIESAPFDGLRSYERIFPDLAQTEKRQVNSRNGLRHTFLRHEEPQIIPAKDSRLDIISTVIKKKPSHLVEALLVVPYNERELDIVDIYNALGSIGNLKDYTRSVNGIDTRVFEDSTRLNNARDRKPVSDPAPATLLPLSETQYIRLTDKYIGQLNIRGEITPSLYGITYSMTNFTDAYYFIFRVIKKESFSTIIYLEPVTEGVLVYSVTGFDVPSFVAKMANLPHHIDIRVTAFISWITAGLKRQGGPLMQK